MFPPPLAPHATWSKHPLSTRKTRQKPKSFLRPGLFSPAPPSNMAGIIRPSARRMPEPWSPAGVASAVCGPAAVKVSIAVPTVLATVIDPSEQVAAGVAAGATLHLRTTVVGSSPPTGLIVIVDCADFPGAIEDGASVPAERLKSGPVTTRVTTVELLEL